MCIVDRGLLIFSPRAPASAYEEYNDADQEQAKGCDEDEVGEQDDYHQTPRKGWWVSASADAT